MPFEDPDTSKLYQKILSGNFEVPDFMSSLVEDILHKILNTDPKKRYTINEIRKHEWFQKHQSKEISKAGIYCGYNKLPIDDDIIDKLKDFDISKLYPSHTLRHNTDNMIDIEYAKNLLYVDHNHMTA